MHPAGFTIIPLTPYRPHDSMGLFRPGGRGPKKFRYEPRYYNPEEEEDLKRRMRAGRKRHQRRNPMSLLYLLGLLLFALFIYQSLG
jgi:hypothetical protein